MNIIPKNIRCLMPILILASTTPLTAQVVRVGGGIRPGHARPPLWVNFNPQDATTNYGPYSPQQILHAYGVDQLPSSNNGSGQTIGIVDAYGDHSLSPVN